MRKNGYYHIGERIGLLKVRQVKEAKKLMHIKDDNLSTGLSCTLVQVIPYSHYEDGAYFYIHELRYVFHRLSSRSSIPEHLQLNEIKHKQEHSASSNIMNERKKGI